ncbi:hypothetical protein AB0G15_08355 [Streptosporangium sp. NPDC023825]|uniref:hypothetical protein n=1 Tax=Streptosporangium sp. NPDC023825 TaxID=3154909 RepID=UPI003429ADB1
MFDCETGGAGETPAETRAGDGAGGNLARGQHGRLPGLPPRPRAPHVSQLRPAQTHLHADQGRVRAGRPGRAARHQAAQHVIKKVADAYTTLHANIRARNLGKAGPARRVRAESTPIAFRAEAAQPFDDRCLSWQIDARTVSIWSVAGRLKNLTFTASAQQLKTLSARRKGESDLAYRDGMWFLIATCDMPTPGVKDPDAFPGWIWASSTSPPPATEPVNAARNIAARGETGWAVSHAA